MTIYLVRHTKAGVRDSWPGDDEQRPLSGRGRLQALGLLELLPRHAVRARSSSPYVRCIETVVPLAAERRMAIEPVEALAEGASLDEAVALVRKHVGQGAVMCSHGDVIPMLLDHYAKNGVDIGPAPQWPKGCMWVLETDATGEVRSAEYVAPPAD